MEIKKSDVPEVNAVNVDADDDIPIRKPLAKYIPKLSSCITAPCGTHKINFKFPADGNVGDATLLS